MIRSFLSHCAVQSFHLDFNVEKHTYKWHFHRLQLVQQSRPRHRSLAEPGKLTSPMRLENNFNLSWNFHEGKESWPDNQNTQTKALASVSNISTQRFLHNTFLGRTFPSTRELLAEKGKKYQKICKEVVCYLHEYSAPVDGVYAAQTVLLHQSQIHEHLFDGQVKIIARAIHCTMRQEHLTVQTRPEKKLTSSGEEVNSTQFWRRTKQILCFCFYVWGSRKRGRVCADLTKRAKV